MALHDHGRLGHFGRLEVFVGLEGWGCIAVVTAFLDCRVFGLGLFVPFQASLISGGKRRLKLQTFSGSGPYFSFNYRQTSDGAGPNERGSIGKITSLCPSCGGGEGDFSFSIIHLIPLAQINFSENPKNLNEIMAIMHATQIASRHGGGPPAQYKRNMKGVWVGLPGPTF